MFRLYIRKMKKNEWYNIKQDNKSIKLAIFFLISLFSY